MEMSVGALDHYNVSTRKLKETVQFYEEILGFVNGPRPQFNFPGAWLYSAGHAVLHLNDISQTDRQQRPDSGVVIPDDEAGGRTFMGRRLPPWLCWR